MITRNSVRVLLLNEEHKILLMCIENFDIAETNGKKINASGVQLEDKLKQENPYKKLL